MGGDPIPGPLDRQVEWFAESIKDLIKAGQISRVDNGRKSDFIQVPREEIRAKKYKCKTGEHIYMSREGIKILVSK